MDEGSPGLLTPHLWLHKIQCFTHNSSLGKVIRVTRLWGSEVFWAQILSWSLWHLKVNLKTHLKHTLPPDSLRKAQFLLYPSQGQVWPDWGRKAASKTTDGTGVALCRRYVRKPRWMNPWDGKPGCRNRSIVLLMRNQKKDQAWGNAHRPACQSPLNTAREHEVKAADKAWDLSPSGQPRLSSAKARFKQGCLEGSICPQHMSLCPPPPDTSGSLELVTQPFSQWSRASFRSPDHQFRKQKPWPHTIFQILSSLGGTFVGANVNEQGYTITVKATVEYCTLWEVLYHMTICLNLTTICKISLIIMPIFQMRLLRLE